MTSNKYHAGMLDQLVAVTRATETPDGMGGVTKAWSTVSTVWAHVRPLSGNEALAFSRIEQRVDHLIVMRAGADVQPADVLVWEERQMAVREIKVTPRSPWLELRAELGAAP